MNKENFKSLYDQWFDPLRYYLYYRSGDENLATDICQDVFITLWRKQIQLPKKKLKPLLYKIARDKYVDWLRKHKSRQVYLQAIPLAWETNDPEEILILKELKNNYEKALAKLPEHQRVVFLMNRMEGLTYKEIAERLDLSVKAIEKRMRLALSTLRTQLYHEK